MHKPSKIKTQVKAIRNKSKDIENNSSKHARLRPVSIIEMNSQNLQLDNTESTQSYSQK